MVMKALQKLFGVCCVFASALAVQGQNRSFSYFNLNVGGVIQQDLKVKEALGLPVSGGKITFDPGFRFDVSGGYSFYDTVRVGLETGWLYNSINELKSGGLTLSPNAAFGSDVSYWQVPILGNVIFTPPTRSIFRPYIGAGVGGVASIIEGSAINTESDFTFAYEGIAGFAFAIAPQMDFGVGYKFLGTLDHTFDTIKTREAYSHSILASFTFRF